MRRGGGGVQRGEVRLVGRALHRAKAGVRLPHRRHALAPHMARAGWWRRCGLLVGPQQLGALQLRHGLKPRWRGGWEPRRRGWYGGMRAPHHQQVGMGKPIGMVRVWASGQWEYKVAEDASNQDENQMFQQRLRPGPS
jgi:hypothetical protein